MVAKSCAGGGAETSNQQTVALLGYSNKYSVFNFIKLGDSYKNLGFLEIKKAKIPKFDEKRN